MKLCRWMKAPLALFISLTFFSKEAYAYIDPGTGSYILQLLMAVVFGALFGIKLFWNKIKDFFKSIFSRGEGNERENE